MPAPSRDPVSFVLYGLTVLAGLGALAYFAFVLEDKPPPRSGQETDAPGRPAAGTSGGTGASADTAAGGGDPTAAESRRLAPEQLFYVRRLETELALDGRLDDAAWGGAVVLGPLEAADDATPWWPLGATELRFAYRPDALYFAVRCREGRASRTRRKPTTRPTAGRESSAPRGHLTVTLTPRNGDATEIKLGARGSVDAPDGVTATHRWTGRAWILEGRIPASGLGVEALQAGRPLRVSVTRTRAHQQGDAGRWSAKWRQPEAGPAHLGLLPAPRRLTAARVAKAPSIDGAMDEDAWQRAPETGTFLFPLADGRADPATTARALWDEDALYLAIRCEEPNSDAVVAELEKRDANVTQEDSIEVFLDGNLDRSTYRQLAFNTLGTRFDMIKPEPGPWNESANAGWDASWRVSVAWPEDKTWVAEARIPFEAFRSEAPEPGDRIGFNLVRNRGADQGEIFQWAPTLTLGNHVPSQFGVLELGSASADAAGPRAARGASPSSASR